MGNVSAPATRLAAQALVDLARRQHDLIQNLREEVGDVRGCGLQNREDVVHDVGRRIRLREDQPHDERDEEEPDNSFHADHHSTPVGATPEGLMYHADRIGGIQRAGPDEVTR